MNQRASHFTLGSTNLNYTSIYNKDYIPKQSIKQNHIVLNPFRGSSLQHDNNKNSFQTTNKQLMQNWGHVEHAKLDQKKLQNLRGHHFTLGNYNPSALQTSHKLFYNQKPLDSQASNKQQESKSKMRMHHHDFKQQDWTNFESNYKKNFSKPQGDFHTVRIKKQQSKDAIILGNHNAQMISTNKLQFTQKKNDNKGSNATKQALHQTSALVLGNNSLAEPMETVNQQYYTVKQIQSNKLPQSTMQELRSTHFNLGSMKQSYKTQNNLYRACSAQKSKDFQIPIYESGSWVDKQAKFIGKTTNKQQFGQKDVQPYKKHQINARGGFELGGYKQNYQTEFKHNFHEKDLNQAKPLLFKKNDSIMIGITKGSYKSEQKASYVDRDLKAAQSSNAQIKAMNTEDHFKIGGMSDQYKLTTYQDQFRSDIKNTNKMFHNKK